MKHLLTLTTLGVAIVSLTGCSVSMGGGNKTTTPTTPTVKQPTTSQLTTTKLNSNYTVFDVEGAENSNFVNGGKLNQLKITVNNQESPTTLDLMSLPEGLSTSDIRAKANINDGLFTYSSQQTMRALKQTDAVVAGANRITPLVVGGIPVDGLLSRMSRKPSYNLSQFQLSGNATNTLPTDSVVHYAGKSFDYSKEGTFDYTINFGKKEGFGQIALDGKTIALEKGNITKLTNQSGFTGYGIQSSKESTNPYTLGIFGKNAEEIAGHTHGTENSTVHGIGFAGTKQ